MNRVSKYVLNYVSNIVTTVQLDTPIYMIFNLLPYNLTSECGQEKKVCVRFMLVLFMFGPKDVPPFSHVFFVFGSKSVSRESNSTL